MPAGPRRALFRARRRAHVFQTQTSTPGAFGPLDALGEAPLRQSVRMESICSASRPPAARLACRPIAHARKPCAANAHCRKSTALASPRYARRSVGASVSQLLPRGHAMSAKGSDDDRVPEGERSRPAKGSRVEALHQPLQLPAAPCSSPQPTTACGCVLTSADDLADLADKAERNTASKKGGKEGSDSDSSSSSDSESGKCRPGERGQSGASCARTSTYRPTSSGATASSACHPGLQGPRARSLRSRAPKKSWRPTGSQCWTDALSCGRRGGCILAVYHNHFTRDAARACSV